MKLYLKISEIDFDKQVRTPENFRAAVANVLNTLSHEDDLREWVIVLLRENGQVELIDGFARAKAFDQLGLSYIPCKLVMGKLNHNTSWPKEVKK